MSLLAPAWEALRAKRPEFAQAEKIWSDVLEPELAAREDARSATIKAAIQRTGIVGASVFLGLLLIVIVMGWLGVGSIFVIIFITIAFASFGSALKWLKVYALKTQTKELVLGAATQSFGFSYETLHPDVSGVTDFTSFRSFAADWAKKHTVKSSRASVSIGGMTVWSSGKDGASDTPPPTPAFDRLRKRALLPSYDHRKFEDLITGTRAGINFSLVECTLIQEQGSGDSRSTVIKFQGILLHIEYPQSFLGRTLLTRSGWWKRGKEARDLQKVQLTSIELDKAFTVYSTDQVEARTLLTPDRMERLIRLERHFKGGKLRGIFEDGHMTLALEAEDQFEAGSIFKPLVDPARYISALEEIGTVCDLIDGFLTREWRGEPED